MAAHGGSVTELGNQIFVLLHQGKRYPKASCDVRIKYEQTIGDIKQAVEKKLGIPADKQQLFWHNKELTKSRDGTTLLELGLHTGSALSGYDLLCVRETEEPDYWPPVKSTPDGLVICC